MPGTSGLRGTVPGAGVAIALLLVASAAHGHGTARVPDAAGSARPIEFPDTADHLTLVVDLHTHSVFSDGHVWPKIRVEEALRDGLDALAVTEHLEYQPHRADLPHPDRNRAVAETLAAAEGSDLIVISGSEITREPPAGHMNAVFLTDANALLQVAEPVDATDVDGYYRAANAWPAEEAVAAANEQGAFVFWNHPYWTRQQPDGRATLTDFHRTLLGRGELHGIEVANGANYSEEAFDIALKHDLVLIGVSDVHDLIDWDYRPDQGGHRPVTLVFAGERSADGIRDALFAGRTVIWFRNLLIGRPEHLMPLLEASLTMTDAHYLPDADVVRFTLENRSDAHFRLRNTTGLTFMEHADLLDVPPHGSATFTAKPGPGRQTLALAFEVENALTAPKTHPLLRLSAPVSPRSAP